MRDLKEFERRWASVQDAGRKSQQISNGVNKTVTLKGPS
jgi:hypothetical protein